MKSLHLDVHCKPSKQSVTDCDELVVPVKSILTLCIKLSASLGPSIQTATLGRPPLKQYKSTSSLRICKKLH